jgi:hypothetical protein
MISSEKIPWQDRPTEPVQEADLYLLETQSYGGNSGSPVFFYLGIDRAAPEGKAEVGIGQRLCVPKTLSGFC